MTGVVKQWNLDHKVGAKVIYTELTGHSVIAVTDSVAYTDLDGDASIYLREIAGHVKLSRVVACKKLKGRSPPK